MKKFLHSFWVLTCILCIVFYSPENAHSNAAGAPTGKSGSPGDSGSTCMSCHNADTPSDFDYFEIISTGFPDQYEEGEVYSFMVDMFTEDESSEYGFQLKAEDDFGNSVGEIIITDPTNTQTVGGGDYLTHTSAGTIGDVGAFWSFDWQAPNDFDGNVTFYAAGIFANGNNQNSGDVLITTNLPITITGAVEEIPGCTDGLATNYDVNATEDDGSCEYGDCTDVNIVVTPLSNPEQLSWNLALPQGTIVYEGSEQATDIILCLPSNNYTFNTYDLTGDGWSGGTYEITTFCNDEDFLLANNNGESPDNGIWNGINLDLESSETFSVEECTPCLGFEIEVDTTYLSSDIATDGTATVSTTLGNGPFEYTWYLNDGEELDFTGNTATDLAAGSYFVEIVDALGCFEEAIFQIDQELEVYITGTGGFTNISTCNGVFYDTGGPDFGYDFFESVIIRICPEDEGTHAQMVFTEFDVVASAWGGDFTIYDGMGTTADVLATAETIELNTPITASMENSTGCLTIQFEAGWNSANGWEAYLSCYDHILYGCMDTEAENYDPTAEEENGSCYYQPGCTDITYVEYHTQGFEADFDDGSCTTPFVDDCTNAEALNYNPDATLNLEQDPCIFDLEDWICGMHYKDERDGQSYGTVLIGDNCWMTENLNYTSSETNTTPISGGVATQFDQGFIYTGQDAYSSDTNGRYYSWEAAEEAVPYSWHLPVAQELESLFEDFNAQDHMMGGTSGLENQSSGGLIQPSGDLMFFSQGSTTWLWSATEIDEGNAMGLTMTESSMTPTFDNIPKVFALSIRAVFGFINGTVLGCTDDDYIEYNEEANTDDGSCEVVAIEGCTDETALNYSEIATVDDDSCIPLIEGCMDNEYVEYNEEATVEDGSCEVIAILGCTDEMAQNYDETANLDDGSCIAHILGCTDEEFAEYNAEATLDDGSCATTAIFGCTDESAFNYNSAANVDDDSCLPYLEGCTDENYIEFNGMANVDDGSCTIPVILGCTIDYALNYNANANTDDGSCEVEGCTNELFVEFDSNANIENGSCTIVAIWGCTNDLYLEFFPPANMDDESCENLIIEGCTDPDYLEYSADVNVDDGSCENIALLGCTNSNYLEYNPEAVVDNNTCLTPVVFGCMDNNYLEYNSDANTDDGSCSIVKVEGCTDPNFIEYNYLANFNNGSCTYIIFEGCTDETYLEYNPNANVDDNSCITPVVFGCTDVLAFNYNPIANTDDDSCVPIVIGCMDLNFVEYNSFANIENNEMCITLVVFGCINEEAINYNPNANTDDGSCYLSLVEIFTVGMANGGMEFTPAILGLGNEYELFWTFDNGTTSSEQNPIIFFEENGTYEIILVVNNGVIEVEASIFVDILNAGLGLNELTNQKQVVSIKYYDIMGREIIYLNRSQNYIYIQKTLYKDGSYEHLKMIRTF